MKALSHRVQQLGQRAATVDSQGERASWYADLLTTCSSCHELVR